MRSILIVGAGQCGLLLLHGDDASSSDANADLAAAAGFRTVVSNQARRGWLPTRRDLFAAARREAEWIYFLENDIETLRAFPSPTAVFLRRRMHCPGCYMSGFMTLAEAASSYGIAPDDLLAEIRAVGADASITGK